MLKITDIKNIDSMITFLKERGRSHDYYYHYTTWNSLTKIFSNKTFVLTRGNSIEINDQHEALMKGSMEEWKKIYVGCFSFGSSEIMAMWGLYCLPWQDAVRIAIPKAKMIKWVNSITQITTFDSIENIVYQENFDLSLNDIVYVSGKKGSDALRLTHNGKSITVSETYPLYGIDTDPKMTGYIKNYAWQYEKEVRLRIRLSSAINAEKISVDIPHDVLRSIKVTTGPCFRWPNDNLQEQLLLEGRIMPSGFEDLVKYKNLCEKCKHKFVRK